MSEQPSGDAASSQPSFLQRVAKLEPRDQRTLGCVAVIAFLVILFVGGWIWSAIFGSGDDREKAYYSCVDVIRKDAPGAKFKMADSAGYSGKDGSWTITSTFTVLGSTVGWTCKAERISDGYYKINWK